MVSDLSTIGRYPFKLESVCIVCIVDLLHDFRNGRFETRMPHLFFFFFFCKKCFCVVNASWHDERTVSSISVHPVHRAPEQAMQSRSSY